MVPRPPITAEQLERLGSAYHDFELVRGELVPVTPPGEEHGILAVALASELRTVVHPRGVGHVYVETGYTLFRTPDVVRGPDVSFRSSAHATGTRARSGFIPGAPDLAVEILSPDDALAELVSKATEYLTAGARLVWLVDPRSRAVYVHRPGQQPQTLREGEVLDGEDVVPGFALPLSQFFAEPD